MSVIAQCLLLAAAVRAAVDQELFSQALEKLPQLAQRAIDEGAVPGLSIAVVFNGSLRFAEGFGVRLIGSNDSVDADTVFQLASVSKPISSTIVAAIVSSSNITWTSPINSPEIIAPYSDPWISSEVTIADGFSHRSGLFGLAGDDLEVIGFNRSTILSRLQYMQPFGPFRATYAYSNYGITAAAIAATDSIDQEWEDVAEKYLYSPLNMTSTSSRYEDFLSRTNRAALHLPGGNDTNTTYPNRWQPSAPRNPTPQAPAGGVTSSANDLAKWVQLHLALGLHEGEQLIGQNALNETRLPHVVRGVNPATNKTGFYGLGWNVDYDDRSGEVYIDHAGAFSDGARTLVKMSVEDGLGIVVLANCFPTGWPEGIADSLFDLVYYGNLTRDWTTFWNGLYEQLGESLTGAEFEGIPPGQGGDGSGSLRMEAYVGRYVNEYVGAMEVSIGAANGSVRGGDSGLVIAFPGQSNLSFPLTHWNRDTFVMYSSPNEPGSGVTFMVGSGNATAVTVEMLNGNGGGMLIREIDQVA